MLQQRSPENWTILLQNHSTFITPNKFDNNSTMSSTIQSIIKFPHLKILTVSVQTSTKHCLYFLFLLSSLKSRTITSTPVFFAHDIDIFKSSDNFLYRHPELFNRTFYSDGHVPTSSPFIMVALGMWLFSTQSVASTTEELNLI